MPTKRPTRAGRRGSTRGPGIIKSGPYAGEHGTVPGSPRPYSNVWYNQRKGGPPRKGRRGSKRK